MTRKVQMMMIVACDIHSDAVMNVLDTQHIGDWVLLPTMQGRRMGRLEYLPPGREHTCDVFLAMADTPGIGRTLKSLTRAIQDKHLCPNCLAYVWEASQVFLANAALDPVCGMAVDSDQALSETLGDGRYYFCCAECRDRFLASPDTYTRRSAADS